MSPTQISRDWQVTFSNQEAVEATSEFSFLGMIVTCLERSDEDMLHQDLRCPRLSGVGWDAFLKCVWAFGGSI